MKAKDQAPKPTQAELEILRILWDKKEATVREVHDVLAQKGETVYTTTLKTMQIMLDKGLLARNEDARSHIYSATIKEDDVQKNLIGNFLQTAFGGSASTLVMQVLGNHKTSNEELQKIRQFLDNIEKQGGV
jgi:predicted transcriptional regulator